MHKQTLRQHLLDSFSETPPHVGTLLACFTPQENIRSQRSSLPDTTAHLCTEESLSTWFDPLEIALDAQQETLVVRFPHPFFAIRFADLFQSLFERKARKLWGAHLNIVYLNTTLLSPPDPSPLAGTTSAPSLLQQPVATGKKHPHPALGNPTPFGEDWTFETFIANGKHKWPLTLAREVTRRTVSKATHQHADIPEEIPGLLVLCGPHGTGKTHLLRAIANELFRTLGNDILYLSLSDLEQIFANRPPFEARQELSRKEALLLDDFQHMSRIQDGTPLPVRSRSVPEKPAGLSLRDELALLLDRFMEQGKPVIIAGVGRPKEWGLGKALFSRLETGLWAELPEPDLDVRMRYAQQQARLRRLVLPREQLLLLAQHCPDIRRLSGAVRRVASHRTLLGRDLVEQDLLNIVRQSGDSSTLTPQHIVSIVGDYCGVPAKEILGEKRRPDLVRARQIAMYLCRELLGHSYPVIGRMFGGKDHSTVMHGVKKIKVLQEHDRLTHTMVTELTKVCLERQE